MTRPISRRTVLRGLGTALSLPFLEAMQPTSGFAAVDPKTVVKRMAFLYVPNGANMVDWTPAQVGTSFQLPYILEPLTPFKDQLLVLSGLTCDKARPHGDGAGDHARECAFLTCAQPKKTASDIKVGISANQVAAQKIGSKTKFASLELGIERGQQAGNCDSGYSCAYQANMSWRSDTTPQAKEIDPRQVFERLFANMNQSTEAAQSKDARELFNKSILDFVQEDANSLRGILGSGDQRKLDEYLTAVREIEQRLKHAQMMNAADAPKSAGPDLSKLVKPTGIPKEYEDHVHLMFDMLVLAFQADLTRIVTLPLANGGSNRSYKNIGVAEGHHDLSHHGKSKEKQDKIKQINKYHVTQLAYLLEKLKGVKEGAGTLLDNSMIVYGSSISDGDRHNHEELPILLLGKGGGTIKPGRHIRYTQKDTPLANLYVVLMDRMGCNVPKFGDSTGRLALP